MYIASEGGGVEEVVDKGVRGGGVKKRGNEEGGGDEEGGK